MMNQFKMGVILSYVNNGVILLIGLVYTPIMIRFLGQSEYGLYSLIGSLVGYLSILDMGLGNAIVRYTARNRAIGNKQNEYQLNGMFLFLYLGIGIVTILVGSVLYYHLDTMFADSLTAEELSKAKIMTLLLIFNFAVSFPLGVFSSIIQAYERFVFLRICNLLRIIINPVIVLPFLYLGYGAVMMVVISTILNISCLLANVYYCFTYLKTKFDFVKVDYLLLKEIAAYSFFIFLNVIMDKLYWSTGQFILGMVSGTTIVAVYSIAVQIIAIYSSFSMVICTAMLPKITMMVANGISNSELSQIMIKTGRLQFIILTYILCMFIVCGKTFILLWVGKEYMDAYYIVIVLMSSLLISLIQTVGISILQATNRNAFRTIIYVCAAIMNVCISIPLAKQYGGLGCAIGISIALLISTGFIINLYYYYKIGINIPLYWKNILPLSLPVVVVIFFGELINQTIIIDTFLFMLIKFIMFSILFIGLMYFGGMNQYEKELMGKPFYIFCKKNKNCPHL